MATSIFTVDGIGSRAIAEPEYPILDAMVRVPIDPLLELVSHVEPMEIASDAAPMLDAMVRVPIDPLLELVASVDPAPELGVGPSIYYDGNNTQTHGWYS